MNNFVKPIDIKLVGFLFAASFLFWQCQDFYQDRENKPFATTFEANFSSSQNEVVLNGEIGGLVGESEVEAHGFIWSKDAAPGFNNGEVINLGKAGNGLFNATLEALDPDVDHYFRAFAEFQGNVDLGEIKQISNSGTNASFTISVDSVRVEPRFDLKQLRVFYSIKQIPDGLRFQDYGLAWGENTAPVVDGGDEFTIERNDEGGNSISDSQLITVKKLGLIYFKAFVRFADGEAKYSTPVVGFDVKDLWTVNPIHKFPPDGALRRDAVSFSLGDYGYLLTGLDPLEDERLKDFWRFSPETGWEELPKFPGDKRSATVAIVLDDDNKQRAYLAIGAQGDRNKLKDFWEFDPALVTDTSSGWTQLADFGGGERNHGTGFSLNGLVYVGLGQDKDNNKLRDFWVYDPENPGVGWTEVAHEYPQSGSTYRDPVSFVIGDAAYVGTGQNNNGLINKFYKFNPNTGWQSIADLPGPARTDAMSFVLDGIGYVSMGLGPDNELADLWAYDPDTDEWTQRQDYPVAPLIQGVSFAIDGKGYMGLGWSIASGAAVDKFWTYNPRE